MIDCEFLDFLHMVENGTPLYSPSFKELPKKLELSGYLFSHTFDENKNYLVYRKFKKAYDESPSFFIELIIDLDKYTNTGRILARYNYKDHHRINSYCEYYTSGSPSILATIIFDSSSKIYYEQKYYYNEDGSIIDFYADYPHPKKVNLKIKHIKSVNGIIKEIKGIYYSYNNKKLVYSSIEQELFLSILDINLSSYTLEQIISEFDKLVSEKHYKVLEMMNL